MYFFFFFNFRCKRSDWTCNGTGVGMGSKDEMRETRVDANSCNAWVAVSEPSTPCNAAIWERIPSNLDFKDERTSESVGGLDAVGG